jgi:hypothetical protein
MVVRSFIERDPAHSFVAARLLFQSMYRDVFGEVDYENLMRCLPPKVYRAIQKGVQSASLIRACSTSISPRLAEHSCLSATATSNISASKRSTPTTSLKSMARATY